MRTEDIPAYVQHVVGFQLVPGTKIVVEAECIGQAKDGQEYTSGKCAPGVVLAVELLPMPDQLMVRVSIEIDAEKGLFIEEIFTEADPDPQFPFVLPKTQEQIELERAEAAAKKEAEGQKSGGRSQQEQPQGPWQDGEAAGEDDPYRHYPRGYGFH